MKTPFTPVLEQVVSRVPGAVGAIFADREGEAIDLVWQVSTLARDELRALGAHFGIVFHQVRRALHTFHYGDPQEIILQHQRLDLVVRAVGAGYYLLLVVRNGHLAIALREAKTAAHALAREMV